MSANLVIEVVESEAKDTRARVFAIYANRMYITTTQADRVSDITDGIEFGAILAGLDPSAITVSKR